MRFIYQSDEIIHTIQSHLRDQKSETTLQMRAKPVDETILIIIYYH